VGHMPKFYWLHKKHHEFSSPFSLVGEYAHPVENFIHGIIPIFCGLAAVSLFSKVHVTTIWADIVFATIISVEEHTGYLLPWNFDYWPGFNLISGGSIHHDWHHREQNGNYGEWWLDRMFGTDFESVWKGKGDTRHKTIWEVIDSGPDEKSKSS